MTRVLVRMAFASLLLFLAGCYDCSINGNTAVYSFQSWVALTVIGVGLAILLIGGGLFFAEHRFRGIAVIFLGLLFFAVVGPGLFLDRLELTDEHLDLNTGFWFMPTKHKVMFADVNSVNMEIKVRTTRSGRQESLVMHFANKNGGTHSVPVGTLMEKALPDILARLNRKNIPVIPPAGQ